MRRAQRLGEERAQTLVFFVVLLAGLVLLLAIVADVGAVAVAQRKAQSVADTAALAAVQQLPFNQATAASTAARYADTGTTLVATFPDSATVTVDTSRQVRAFFAGLAGIFNSTAKAEATAQVAPPVSLDNSILSDPAKAGKNPPYLVPLVIGQASIDSVLSTCSSSSCLPSSPITLRYDNGDIGVMCPSAGSCGGKALSQAMQCNKCMSGSYGASTSVTQATEPAANGIGGALRKVEGTTLILPVVSGSQISGFAAFVIDPASGGVLSWKKDSAACQPDCKDLVGYFTTYTTPGFVPSTESAGTDYGVRVMGLIH